MSCVAGTNVKAEENITQGGAREGETRAAGQVSQQLTPRAD